MMSVISSGLAWGTPVRPDLLGKHLEAYKQIVPTLQALRLCHRFGKGADVHITKLPHELLQSIESLMLKQYLSRWQGGWESRFACFEGRCQPIDHLETGYFDILEEVEAYPYSALCTSCKEEGAFCNQHRCEKAKEGLQSCIDGLNEMMNDELLDDEGMLYEDCRGNREHWKRMIGQKPEGEFAQYDKVLREHFGLEAYFAITRKTMDSDAPWPKHNSRGWHSEDELQTTICYLTLPTKMIAEKRYGLSELESEMGDFEMHVSQSSLVLPPKLDDKEKRVRQFQRALRMLNLKPYVHPSQLNETISASSVQESVEQAALKPTNSGDERIDVTEHSGIEWPQLVMLVKASFDGY